MGNVPRPKALPVGRVKPRDRSTELGDFYRELRLWVRSANVDKVAEMSRTFLLRSMSDWRASSRFDGFLIVFHP